jgi:hypothetical protein
VVPGWANGMFTILGDFYKLLAKNGVFFDNQCYVLPK